MNTRLMAGAFLSYGGKILLLHRGLHKSLAPGMWSCVGGHMEPEEYNNPLAACLRELHEEAGIKRGDIQSIALRYIVTRRGADEIITVYYFTGSLIGEVDLPYCDEGTLHWVKPEDIPGLPMTFSVRQITSHWLRNPGAQSVILCGINSGNDKIAMVEL